MFYSNNENAIEWLRGDESITVTLSDPHFWAVVRRLAKKHPDKVQILAEPKENGGYMYAHLPVEFLRIQAPPRTPTVSDEQRARGRQLIEEARRAQNIVRTDEGIEPKTASNGSEV